MMRFDEAIDSYNKALSGRPDFLEAIFNRGLAFGRKGDWHQALESFNQAVQDGDEEVLYSISVAMLHLHRDADALSVLARVLEAEPNHAEALQNRSILLAQQGNYAAALVDIERALDLKPKDATLLDIKGNVLAQLGRFDEAIACYRRALKSHPGRADTYFNLAKTLDAAGRHQHALEAVDSALRTNPEDAGYRALRAQIVDGFLWRMVKRGVASWSGGKPKGAIPRVRMDLDRPLSDYVVESRR
jgi:tetratricopeptide (TPR) repeat protein